MVSRSYKHVPCARDSERSRVPNRYKAKTIANRAVRRNENISNHSGYRKAYESWDICDYKFFKTEEQLLNDWKNGRGGPKFMKLSYKEAKRSWRKWYKSK